MRKIAKGRVAIAIGLMAILLIGITTAAAPSANKERTETEYITELSAASWTDPSVYEDGYRAESVKQNGQAVTGSFSFEKDDIMTIEVPGELTGSYKIGLLYHANETAETSDVLFTVGYGESTYTAYLPLVWQDSVEQERYPTDRYGNERANTQVAHVGTVFSALSDNSDINMEDIVLELSGGSIIVTNITQSVVIEEIWLYQEKQPRETHCMSNSGFRDARFSEYPFSAGRRKERRVSSHSPHRYLP